MERAAMILWEITKAREPISHFYSTLRSPKHAARILAEWSADHPLLAETLSPDGARMFAAYGN
jgi:hypothetical protein